MAVNIEWKKNGIIAKFVGKVTIQEINESNRVMHGDARFDDLQYQISDFLEADPSLVSFDDALVPAATDLGASRTVHEMKIALIIQEPTAVELGKHYIEISKKLGSPWQFALFSCMEDAMKWVEPPGGLPSPGAGYSAVQPDLDCGQ
jgi:hypothetical protein